MNNHEEIVLGSMLLDPRIINEVLDIITGPDFHEPRHETVFDAIIATEAAGNPVSTVSVGDELQASGSLARIGGLAYLHSLIGAVVIASNAAYYATKIRDASIVRQVGAVAVRLNQLSEGADTDAALDVVNEARAQLDRLIITDQGDVPNSVAVFQAIDAMDDPPGLPTPWTPLTDYLAGWEKGLFYIAGARPAKGKTVFVVQAALNVAFQGKTAVIFSLEMKKTEIYHRMLCSLSEVPADRIRHRRLTADDRERLNDAARKIARLPLVVHDQSSMSIAQIRAKVVDAQRDGEVGLVVVDYLSLIRPPKGGFDRRVQVDDIARGLKGIAKDLNVPLLSAAQLNRAVESRASGEPGLADLRESGQIEQEADAVMLLHRTPENEEELHVIVVKNRQGVLGRFALVFQGRFGRLVEMGQL